MKRWFTFLLLISLAACGARKDRVQGTGMGRDTVISPPGYDLAKPEKFTMPEELHEISGIAFNQGNPDTIYAEQDEAGKVYHFKPGSPSMIISKFGKRGDFEDIAIANGYVVMLRSDGVLFSFPLNQVNQAKMDSVQNWEGLLPDGEMEGLAAIEKSGEIYVLCKHCSQDKTSKTCSGTVLKLLEGGKLKAAGHFVINVTLIEKLIQSGKISFHPSALGLNPITGEWWILSSVNKLLVVTDAQWKPVIVYHLDPSLFNQPEGIAFDRNNNLYISNEGGESGKGTILKFAFKATSK